MAADKDKGANTPDELTDDVAMVSRNADGSDAQPHKTVRILDRKASAEADKAQARGNSAK